MTTVSIARRLETLEVQAQALMKEFASAGYMTVSPPLIQPADVFLDVVGEALRVRTYVFTDPDGAELCLRPDITVPVCRHYLQRHPAADAVARYCYHGPAFRFQPANAGAAHPREFRQAGFECFGVADREAADAEVLSLTLRGLAAAGFTDYSLRTGDIEVVHALLDQLDVPARWRQRLKQRFWQPDNFRAALNRMATDPAGPARGLPQTLIDRLDPTDPLDARIVIGRHLDTLGLEIIGTRTLSEITERVLEIVADARLPKLAPETSRLIGDVLAVTSPIRDAARTIGDLVPRHSVELTRALGAFERRVAALDAAGVDLGRTHFDADFGRNFEYYTGFVFEVQSADLGAPSPVAGGGRYDGLMQVVGAPKSVPAVGCAVHTERLLSCIARSRG